MASGLKHILSHRKITVNLKLFALVFGFWLLELFGGLLWLSIKISGLDSTELWNCEDVLGQRDAIPFLKKKIIHVVKDMVSESFERTAFASAPGMKVALVSGQQMFNLREMNKLANVAKKMSWQSIQTCLRMLLFYRIIWLESAL